ncbi:MAG: hypothetical protein HY698_06635 [Deltaproteobacteria bacterium]|nr:hypothetical protein [Deltaproteobacteria bacterium]
MKVLNEPGVATQFDPESCVGGRKDAGEALTGERAGRVLSREIHAPSRKRRVLRDADAVEMGGRPHPTCRYREARRDPARSETPSTRGITAYGNREIPRPSGADEAADRVGKPKGARR